MRLSTGGACDVAAGATLSGVLTDRGVLPADDASAWDWLLFQQSRVVTTGQAVEHLGRPRVRHLVDAKQWRRICRGVLLTYDGPLTTAQQLWVAVLAAGRGAVLAGLAAAVDGGLRRFRVDRIDVLVRAARPYPDLLRRLPIDMPAVFVRRTRSLPRRQVVPGLPTRTSAARSLVDAASWARTDDETRRIVAAGVQQRLVLPRELLEIVEPRTHLPRRRLIVETVRDAAGGAEALSEIDFLRLCRRHGLPTPELQRKRTDAAGRTRYLDAYWPEHRVHVEVDGAHHMDAREWEADMRRQNDVWLEGDRILRFTAAQIRHRPTEVAAQLRRALGLPAIEKS